MEEKGVGSCTFHICRQIREGSPKLASTAPLLYYSYRPHIRMARTLFANTLSVISAAEGAPGLLSGHHFDPKNQCAQGLGATVNSQ